VGVDCAILMNPAVWEASGHVGGFNDPMMDCRACKERFRADKIIEDYCVAKSNDEKTAPTEAQMFSKVSPDGWSNDELKAFIEKYNIPCPTCGKHDFTDIRQFNMMFKTFAGVTEDKQTTVYLRPETAQGIFVNFKNVQRTTRRRVPFGIAQVGHAFRNEITPGNFTFRTREFEQMELEFFCEPDTDLEWFDYWKKFCIEWLHGLGMPDASLRVRDHSPEQLSHYSKATTDIEYLFPFGWGELWGIADRTDFDLKQHMEHSGEDMTYIDPTDTTKRYIPYCIEPSLGLTRMTLAFLCEAYDEEELGTAEKSDIRTVLRLHPALAPVKAAVLPLSKKLGEGALPVYHALCKDFVCEYDDTGSIGKRYRRQDEIGTPFCITYDFDSETDGAVTIRKRDCMTQERVPISQLKEYLSEKLAY
jgi:glycyl-tRNA synthetase